ncbi:hypothetical protein FB451DRAFT_1413197 [Mycena latifolia]|nr:hypothetical protein FB451DRAFT_1413197 [Mycena latifolia]
MGGEDNARRVWSSARGSRRRRRGLGVSNSHPTPARMLFLISTAGTECAARPAEYAGYAVPAGDAALPDAVRFFLRAGPQSSSPWLALARKNLSRDQPLSIGEFKRGFFVLLSFPLVDLASQSPSCFSLVFS